MKTLDHRVSRRNKNGITSRMGLCNSSKFYFSDNDRYSGLPTDNLARNTCLFEERCDQASFASHDKYRAFSIMLAGCALEFYFDNLQNKGLCSTK